MSKRRWARHTQMRDMTITWAQNRDFGLFAQDGYSPHTITTVDNRTQHGCRGHGEVHGTARSWGMDQGYGKIKGKTFRICAHGRHVLHGPRRGPVGHRRVF
ncbi:MAG: hypothetical protein U0694_28735 [Anaerolineae bacterium]